MEIDQNKQEIDTQTKRTEEWVYKNFELEEIDEYIVTLKNKEDLEQFYDDLETPGGTECVPDRCVECANRRPISRNTHYHLKKDEVETLMQDDRVLNIIPKKLKDSAHIKPLGWIQNSSEWDKSQTVVASHRAWALLRCIEGSQRTNWGADNTPAVTGIVTATSSGKNVDVVIVDGFVKPSHPEFAVNEDGTGGSRVIQFNWGSLNSIVGYGPNDTYTYPTTYTNYGDDHGNHVAGTACGNRYGWARDANIYNIYVYGATNGPSTYPFDYVRAFHLTKPINPETGLRNPTIMNNSWGYGLALERSAITSIVYRGITYPAPISDAQLQVLGINAYNYDSTYIGLEGWFDSDVVDIQDAISDGVIVVGAAGNSFYKIDVVGGVDYDNRINAYGFEYYYHRGSANTSGSSAICVGAIDNTTLDRKANFSNVGPRVNIFAPGTSTISSVPISAPQYYNNSLTTPQDSRSSTNFVDKYGGTSMASPNVCGLLACALEQYPRMDNAGALEYLQKLSKPQVYDSTTSGLSCGVTGVCNQLSRLTGTESFCYFPNNTSFRISTSNSTTGVASSITNNLLGAASLTSSTTPTNGTNDDGFWNLTVPWSVTYCGISSPTIYVGTNSYITFGSGSDVYNSSFANPGVYKIMIHSGDRSCQRIYYGTEGSSPNRTYRVRWEGHYTYTNPPPVGVSTMIWEAVFYENATNQIDIHVGSNISLNAAYSDVYNLQESGNRYLFYRQDRPIKGTVLPRVGERVRKTSGQTWPRMGTLRYKQST